MAMNDLISNYLTRIRNGLLAGKENVSGIPSSKIIEEISRVLKEEGYISDFRINEINGKKTVSVDLKYYRNKSVISNIQRVSSGGRRVYSQSADIPFIREGLGVSIVTTSKGVMTDAKARELNVGGEIICKIW
ncbi:MAG TPA: 30S ribosomal protein S8 [bacterium]|jgi:small subunit ribosomal protein S8|nr:30S ribosomal protein S8 [bacterium]